MTDAILPYNGQVNPSSASAAQSLPDGRGEDKKLFAPSTPGGLLAPVRPADSSSSSSTILTEMEMEKKSDGDLARPPHVLNCEKIEEEKEKHVVEKKREEEEKDEVEAEAKQVVPAAAAAAATAGSDISSLRSANPPGDDDAPTVTKTKAGAAEPGNGKAMEIEEVLEARVVAEQEDRSGWYIWFLAFTAGISGLLFGYDTGVISGALVSIGTDLGGHALSDLHKEMITSGTSLGALIGAICAGSLADLFGRKSVILVANVIFLVGAIMQAASKDLGLMLAGRFVIGIGVGTASLVVPLYIGEIAPTKLRGRLVTINVVFITLGQVVAYGIGAGFESVKGGWRYDVGGGGIPAIIQLLSLLYLPESPRYLIRKGRTDEAMRVFRRVYPFSTDAQLELKVKVIGVSISEAIEIDQRMSWIAKVRTMVTVGANRRAMLVSMGMQALQQLSGFNTLMYYSATIFAAVGFKNPTAVSLVVSVTNFVFTLFALKYIDIIGRRRIMLWSVPGMVLGLVFGSVCFHFLTIHTNNRLPSGGTDTYNYPRVWSSLLILAMIFYVASYATGAGNVPWQQGELFGMEVRGLGASAATACNWGANLLIGATYLSLMDRITPAGAFGFYAGLCALGWVCILFGYPDTSGLSLEETKTVFQSGWGIRKAEQLRREKREIARANKATAANGTGHVVVAEKA